MAGDIGQIPISPLREPLCNIYRKYDILRYFLLIFLLYNIFHEKIAKKHDYNRFSSKFRTSVKMLSEINKGYFNIYKNSLSKKYCKYSEYTLY